MIRKIYLDFIREKMSAGEMNWIISRALQYLFIHASFLVRKPLCGPILGTLVTNYRCNFRCKMCDLPARGAELQRRGKKELPTPAMMHLIRDFAAIGASGIGFTGGEPLLRHDIFELLAYTRKLGMISHLNTNGFFLNDGAVQKILDAQLDSINISLDGACAATHDGIRGVPGAFDRVIKGAACLNEMRKQKKSSVRIKAVAVIDETNIDEARDMLQLTRDIGFDCIEFIPKQRFSTSGKADRVPDSRFMKKLEALQKFLLETQDPGIKIENSPAHIRLFKHSFSGLDSPIPCYAAYNSLAIDCYGEIYPCVPWVNWGRAAGNIAEKGLKKFWYSQEYTSIRKDIRTCRRCYLNCQAELNIMFNLRKSYRKSAAYSPTNSTNREGGRAAVP